MVESEKLEAAKDEETDDKSGIYKVECDTEPATFASNFLIPVEAMSYEELCIWISETFEAKHVTCLKFPKRWNILFNRAEEDIEEKWERELARKFIDLNISIDLSEERNLRNDLEDDVF